MLERLLVLCPVHRLPLHQVCRPLCTFFSAQFFSAHSVVAGAGYGVVECPLAVILHLPCVCWRTGERGDVGSVRVVGRPVAGFFIDEENFNPGTPSYAQDIQYGVAMFNSTPVLSSACKAAHPTQL